MGDQDDQEFEGSYLFNFHNIPNSEFFYFGQSVNRNAEGYGSLFSDSGGNLMIGEWKNGRIVQCFTPVEEAPIKDGDMLILREMTVVYSSIRVWNLNMTDFRRNANCKHEIFCNSFEFTINSSNVYLKSFIFTKGFYFHSLLKTLHVLNLLKDKAYSLRLNPLAFDFSLNHFDFTLITQGELQKSKEFLKENKDLATRHMACSQFITLMSFLHGNGIAVDFINYDTIYFSNLVHGKFVIYDYSRAIILDRNNNQEKHMTERILTVSREFRAPETYKEKMYSPFKSDVYSAMLFILTVLTDVDLSLASRQDIDQQIKSLPNEARLMFEMALHEDPKKRPEIARMASSFEHSTTTML